MGNAWLVIEILIGIGNLKVHYWIRDGVVLSVACNLLVWPLLALAKESIGPLWYGVAGLVLVNVVSFASYFLFMAALLS